MEWNKETLEAALREFLEKHHIPAQKDPGDGKFYIYMNQAGGSQDDEALKIALDVQDSCILSDTYLPVGIISMKTQPKIYYLMNLINAHSDFGMLYLTEKGKVCLHYPVDMTARDGQEDVFADLIAFPGYASKDIMRALEPVVEYDADPDKVFEKVYGKRV